MKKKHVALKKLELQKSRISYLNFLQQVKGGTEFTFATIDEHSGCPQCNEQTPPGGPGTGSLCQNNCTAHCV